MDASQIVIRPVVSDAHKTHIRQAVEELFP